MAKCKYRFCGKEFNPDTGWRNDCPKEFCSWYCAIEEKRSVDYLKEKEAKMKKLEKRLHKKAFP